MARRGRNSSPLSNPVVIRVFPSRIEAELARSALKAAKIISLVSADDVGGTDQALWLLTGVKLLVRASDADAARLILGPEGESG